MARIFGLAATAGLASLVTLAEATAVPAWCNNVPQQYRSQACRGSNASGCACQSFCSSTDPGSMRWNTECCGCTGARAPTLAELDPPAPEGAVPAWCQYVPAQFQSVACRGGSSSGCSCAGWCANTTQGSWQWNTECCGCGQGGLPNATDANTTTAPPPPAVVASGAPAGRVSLRGAMLAAVPAASPVPAWCQNVPAEYRSAACRGSNGAGCTCKDFCAKTDKGSMQWNTECCGCAGVKFSEVAPLLLTSLQSAGMPAWCQYVPGQYQQTACRGSQSGGCTCKDFCAKEDRGSWQWNPECCGCSGAAKPSTVPHQGSSPHAALLAQPEAAAEALVAVASTGKPAWCQYVPGQYQQTACRGSNGAGCTCKDFCAKEDKGSMQWNTECCGCAGVKFSEVAPLLLTSLQSAGVPSWCQYVPGQYQQTACRGSRSGGCTCKDFCAKEDRGSWQWNPECCGCSGAAQPANVPHQAASPSHKTLLTQAEAGAESLVAVASTGKPAWCQYVPGQYQQAACRGSNGAGCTCKDFCAKEDKGSMQWNTECCGCAGVKFSEVAPLLLTSLQSAAVPAWCQYVPGQYQQAACRGSRSGGCTCKDFCAKEDRGSWQWNPECCGCK